MTKPQFAYPSGLLSKGSVKILALKNSPWGWRWWERLGWNSWDDTGPCGNELYLVWAGHRFQKMKMFCASILRTLNKYIQINSAFFQNYSVLADWLFQCVIFSEPKGVFFLFLAVFQPPGSQDFHASYNVWNCNTYLDLRWLSLIGQVSKSRASVWLVIIIALALDTISPPFKHSREGFCTSADYSILPFTKHPLGEGKP